MKTFWCSGELLLLPLRSRGFESRILQKSSAVLRAPDFFFQVAAPRAPSFCLCTKRQKGRLERTAKPQAQGSIPAAAAGRPNRDDTATEPVGAGALDGRKWSPEAKNWHAGCRKGRLDGRAESDPWEQNNTMRSRGTFLHFQIDFTGFASGAAPPKTVP